METIFRLMTLHLLLSFKSYYVVWKRSYVLNPILPIFCLNRTMQYGNSEVKTACELLTERLNRTMQYGNFSAGLYHLLFSLPFKSYYVVWKQVNILRIRYFFPCLNRTMQYGNYNQSQTDLWISATGLNRTMQYGNQSQ